LLAGLVGLASAAWLWLEAAPQTDPQPPPDLPDRRQSPQEPEEVVCPEPTWSNWIAEVVAGSQAQACFQQFTEARRCDDADFAADYYYSASKNAVGEICDFAEIYDPGQSHRACPGDIGQASRWATRCLNRAKATADAEATRRAQALVDKYRDML
jgi:hypothetical protein